MASFKEDAKANLKSNFRQAVEDHTGIIGQVLKDRREKEEKNQQIEHEVSLVDQTTQAIRVTGKTLTQIELFFTQISKNFQAINKSFDVVVTTQDETNKASKQHAASEAIVQKKAGVSATLKPAKEETADDAETQLSSFDPTDFLGEDGGKKKKGNERKNKQKEERKRKREQEKRNNKANREAQKARERIEREGKAQGKTPKQIEKEIRQEAKRIARKALEKPTPGKIAKLMEKGGKLFGLASKAISKALPGIGVAAGAVDAGVRLWEGDYRGGAISAFQTALGAVGLFGNAVLPGAASIAAGIAVIAAEIELQKGDIYLSVYGEPYPINPTPEEEKAMDLALTMVKDLLIKQLKELVAKIVGNSPPKPPEGMEFDAEGNVIQSPTPQPIKKALAIPPAPPPQPVAKPAPPPPPAPVVKPTPAAAPVAAAPAPAPAPAAPPPPASGSDKETMDMIKKNEGFKNKPYQDSLGLWTVGVGHLIGDGKTLPPAWDRTFTNQEIDTLFAVDFQHHKELAAKSPGWEKANDKAKMGIIDLTFNMGGAWFKKFKNASAAMAAGDFQKAADELKYKDETKTKLSNWYQQVKGRAERTTALIAAGGAPSTGTQVAQQSQDVAGTKTDMKRNQQPDVNIVKINDVNVKRVAA